MGTTELNCPGDRPVAATTFCAYNEAMNFYTFMHTFSYSLSLKVISAAFQQRRHACELSTRVNQRLSTNGIVKKIADSRNKHNMLPVNKPGRIGHTPSWRNNLME
jgi:hypothetical protein